MLTNTAFALRICLAASLLLFLACSSPAVLQESKGNMAGGPCQYQEIIGHALITSVGPAEPQEYNCPNQAQKVLFSFYPDNEGAAAKYLFPGWADEGNSLSVAGGANPPAAWVLRQGIEPGVKIPAIRAEIVSGTCTPVVFSFPGLDMESALEECWKQNR
ncbi:MAG: hypothetical protein QMD09_02675 [Desulfatibacillaceae bacterium]|nr:hypothetical protein [Desulfatibacillaceae bacterium]